MSINLIEKLKEKGVELTPEIEKELGGEYLSVQESEKKVKKVEQERDRYKTDYEAASETLKGFDGKDFEQIEKDRDAWKQKAEDAEKDYQRQIELRDYSDLVDKAVSDIRFTSVSAQKAFKDELMKNPLPVRDGALLGFDDFRTAYQKEDAGAFVTEDNEKAAQFTDRYSKGQVSTEDAMTASLRSVMGLPDTGKTKGD